MNIRINESTNLRINSHIKGFTLIEVLVVLTILIIIAVISGNIFVTTLRSNTRTQTSTNLKQKGDYGLMVIERMIRESTEVECISDNELRIVYKDGQQTVFTCASNRVASNAAVLIEPIDCMDFSFSCSLPRVDISFVLNQNPDDPLPFKRSEVNFQTSVTARNL